MPCVHIFEIKHLILFHIVNDVHYLNLNEHFSRTQEHFLAKEKRKALNCTDLN